jgi:hypothetical protein
MPEQRVCSVEQFDNLSRLRRHDPRPRNQPQQERDSNNVIRPQKVLHILFSKIL